MPSEPLLDLLKQRDEEIAEADGLIADGQATVDYLVRMRADLVVEREALAEMAAKRGLAVPTPETVAPTPESDADWSNMKLVDAVERLLQVVAPEALHLSQIEVGLHQRNRWGDKAESIPGTLAHLKKTRGTVVPLGQGRWAYNGAGVNAAGFPPARSIDAAEGVMDAYARETQARIHGGLHLPDPPHDPSGVGRAPH